MKLNLIKLLPFLAIMAVTGCGGGGGGGAPAPTTTTITGVASKGPINGGTVTVFAVRNGAVAEQLPNATTTATTVNGSYSINIGAYTGPVLVQISGGSFVDEGTGNNVTLSIPLRAFVASAAPGTVSAAVTAITEIAARQTLLAATIDAATINKENGEAGALFGLSDIIGTQPVAATQALPAGTTTAQRDYAIALASVSQYGASNSKTLGQTLDDLDDPTPTPAVLTALSSAITSFITSPRNLTGFNGNVGSTQVAITLNTQGTLPTGTLIGGVNLAINLPAGINKPTFEAGTTNQLRATDLQFSSSVPASTNRSIFGGYTSAGATTPAMIRVGAIHLQGFGTGPFATLILTKTASSVITPNHFIITEFNAADNSNSANTLTGLGPGLGATFQ